MFLEYVPYKLMFFSIVAMLMLIHANDGEKYLYKYSTIAIIVIFMLIGVYIKDTVRENINKFRYNIAFSCNVPSTNTDQKYNVSIKNGWIVDDNYFVNDIYRIRVDNCNEIGK